MAKEKKEWSRMWSDNSDSDDPRILLIGDSIVNGIQHEVFDLLPDGLEGSSYATSKGVDSEFFTREVELLAEQDGGEYAVIYFNNGLHFHGQTPDEYEANYRKRLARLKESIRCDKWILGLSTPITASPNDPSLTDTPITSDCGLPFDKKNDTVIEFNKRVVKIAGELGYEIFDAYSFMEDKSAYKIDSCHYNDKGRRLLAEVVAAKIIEIYER